MSDTSSHTKTWQRELVPIGIVVIAVIAAFWPVCSAQFLNWDDREQILSNPDFNPPKFSRMLEYLRGPYMGSLYPISYWYLGGVAAIAQQQPDAAGDRINPRPFHVGNLVLHALVAVGVLLLLRQLGFGRMPATVGALLFALHPVHVDAVAWIAGFNTVLSGLFSVIAIGLYLQFARLRAEKNGRASIWYALASLAYLLALLSKPSAVVVPLIAAILDVGFIRLDWRRIVLPLGLWLCAAVPFMIITRSLQTAAGVMETPLWFRPIVAADAIAFYAMHVLMPIRLLVDYGRSPASLLQSGTWHFTCLVTLALAGVAFAWRRVARPITVGIGVFVAGLVPVLGLTPFNGQTISTVSDRFLYLSMIGVAIVAAHLMTVGPRKLAMTIAVVVLFALSIRTAVRCTDWHDDQTLFTRELCGNPNSLAAHEVLGAAASSAHDWPGAIDHYSVALRVNPRDKRIPFNLGNALLQSGKPSDAIPYYRLAIKDQNLSASRDPRDPRLPYNLGIAQAQTGDLAAAEASFDAALRIRGDFDPAMRALQRVRDMRATTRPASTRP